MEMKKTAALLAATLGWASPTHADETKTRADERMALVSSGGVSQGAYQAGVTYAFIVAQRERGRRIDVATGASAGNINSILSAITQCAPDDAYHALANPFVDAWLNVGWDKLFPGPRHQTQDEYRHLFSDELGTPELIARARAHAARRDLPRASVYTDEDGAVARTAAFAVAEAHIIDLIDRGRYRPDCGMYAGVTLTPVSPQTLTASHADGASTILHQRTLVSFSLASRPGGGLKVEDESVTDGRWSDLSRSLTERASNGDGLLKLMKAGSAFPIAFAPIDLASVIEARDEESTRYSDGGVFDNVPLGLAERLIHAKPSTVAPTTHYYYSDPDLLRGQIRRVARALGAYDAAATSITTYIGETRRHEIQTAMLHDGVHPRVLDRFHPIVSGEATTFGAFAHRRFRIHDYLIGLYDGLIGSSPHPDNAEGTDLFFIDQLRNLAAAVPETGTFLARSALVDTLVWLRREELSRREGARRADEFCEDFKANWKRLAPAERVVCASARPAAELTPIFDYLAQLDRDRRSAASSGDRWDDPSMLVILQNIAPELRVHATSSELGTDAYGWLRATYDLVLDRMRAIEDADQDVLSSRPKFVEWDIDHVMGAMHPLLRGFILRPLAAGPTMGSDSIPARDIVDVAWHLVPYYISADVGMGGLHLGWRPQLRFASRWFVSGSIGLHFPSLDPLERVLLVRPRLGVGLVFFMDADWRVPLVEIDAGVLAGDIDRFRDSLGGELLVTIFGKLQLGLGLTHPVSDRERTTNLSQFLSVTVGVADLNGLLRGLLEVACW